MKEFTEDEKIIAMHINKKYKWMARDKSGGLYIYMSKPTKKGSSSNWLVDNFLYINIKNFIDAKDMFSSIKWEDDEPTLIRDIYDSRILDDAEKEYLAAALKPLTKVKCIIKARSPIYQEREYLGVNFETGEVMVFPFFEEQTMYKGMKTDKAYTPEELGLDL